MLRREDGDVGGEKEGGRIIGGMFSHLIQILFKRLFMPFFIKWSCFQSLTVN